MGGMLVLYTFGNFETRDNDGKALAGIGWRLILGIGALPGLILIPFKTAEANRPQTTTVQAQERMSLVDALRNPRYWRPLIGCAGGWFLFDITFYGNTLFAPTVLKDVFHNTNTHG